MIETIIENWNFAFLLMCVIGLFFLDNFLEGEK